MTTAHNFDAIINVASSVEVEAKKAQLRFEALQSEQAELEKLLSKINDATDDAKRKHKTLRLKREANNTTIEIRQGVLQQMRSHMNSLRQQSATDSTNGPAEVYNNTCRRMHDLSDKLTHNSTWFNTNSDNDGTVETSQ